MLTGIKEAGNVLVNKQFFDTLTIIPRVDSDVIARQARIREINLRYFPNGMVNYSLELYVISLQLSYFVQI